MARKPRKTDEEKAALKAEKDALKAEKFGKTAKGKREALKKLTEPSKPFVVGDYVDPVTSVNVESGPKTGAPVQGDVDAMVRDADLKRSADQQVEMAHHANEALEAAGLPTEGYDKQLMGKLAAIPAPGASGMLGPVTARKVMEVYDGHRKK